MAPDSKSNWPFRSLLGGRRDRDRDQYEYDELAVASPASSRGPVLPGDHEDGDSYVYLSKKGNVRLHMLCIFFALASFVFG